MDLAFLVGVVWTITKTIRGITGAGRNVAGRRPGPKQSSAPKSAGGRTVRDPVCGMFVSTEVSHRLTHGKEVLHFCSQDCLEKYEKEMAKVKC